MSTDKQRQNSFYDPELLQIIEAALKEIRNDVRRLMPRSSDTIVRWIEDLAGPSSAEERFTSPTMYPVLALPWWVGKSVQAGPNRAFHRSLAYASINAYYHIRLVDNIMDEEDEVEVDILPASGLFQTQALMALLEHFGGDHTFWETYRSEWCKSADYAISDAGFEVIGRETFLAVSSQKTVAARIPVAAACHFYELEDRAAAWLLFCDQLGCYHQMHDDLADWMRDERRSRNTTFLLSEAEKRKDENESVMSWLAREGFDWSMRELRHWLTELEVTSSRLSSDDVASYLKFKSGQLERWSGKLEAAFDALDSINATFRSPSESD